MSLASLTASYNQITKFASEENRYLQRIIDWSTEYDRGFLNKPENTAKINKVFQKALACDKLVHNLVSGLNFGKDYMKAKSTPGGVDALKKAHDQMRSQLMILEHKMGETTRHLLNEAHSEAIPEAQRLKFNPKAPSFREKLAERYTQFKEVVSHLASPIQFVKNHPYATVASLTGLVAAGSLAVYRPETTAKLINSVMPSFAHGTVSGFFADRCPDLCELEESQACVNSGAGWLAAGAGVAALAAAQLGARESLGEVKEAYQSGGLRAVANLSAQGVKSTFKSFGQYAKNANLTGIAGAATIGAIGYAAGAPGVPTAAAAALWGGSHLALNAAHKAFSKPPVALNDSF